jgi:hypothetical protein
MKPRRGLQIVVLLVTLGLLAWGVTIGVERLAAPDRESATPPPAPLQPTAHITATLFYAAPDGLGLVPLRREVPLAEGVVAQGREILIAQLAAAPEGQRAVIPAGTQLRAFYVTDRGDAFVDLSGIVTSAHPGGSMNELLTVYALVNAVTANLPAVQRVQLLVDGTEVDTIAGHVDVRRPLVPDTSLVRDTAAGH